MISALDYYPFGSLMPGRQYNSSLYRYGFNGQEEDDEVKGVGNSLDFGARIYDPRLGRWPSIDLHAAKYPSISSYAFVANSPLKFVDKDGKDIYAIGSAADVTKYVAQLRKSTSLDVSFNPLNNQITFSGTAKNKADQALLSASADQNINVNLYVTTATQFKSRTNQTPVLLGGSFEGSEVVNGKVNTIQWINPDHFEMLETQKVGDAGKAAKHELLEAYIGAQNSPGFMPIPRTSSGGPSAQYLNAHNAANALSNSPVEAESDGRRNFNFVNINNNKRTTSFTISGVVADRQSLELSASQSQTAARAVANAWSGKNESVTIPKIESGCTLR